MQRNNLTHSNKNDTSYIAKTLKELSKLKAQDGIIRTTTSRSLLDYNLQLDLRKTIQESIKERFLATGRKVKLLDVGCGKGVAIDNLLSDKALEPYLESCTGISMHYLTDINKLVEKHGERFIYKHGEAQDILSTEVNSFDYILDVWGAFPYTINKIRLLELYHQALSQDGKAEIYMCENQSMLYQKEQTENELLPYICQQYPETFSRREYSLEYPENIRLNDICITMTKATDNFPLPLLKVKRAEQKRVPGTAACYTDKEVKKFSSVYPGTVLFGPLNEPPSPKKFYQVASDACCIM